MVNDGVCRDSWIKNLTKENFLTFTCSKCFVQVFHDTKQLKLQFPLKAPFLLYDNKTQKELYPDAFHHNSKICDTYLSNEECMNWKMCCADASNCCDKMINENNFVGSGFCSTTWDGISCWMKAPHDSIIENNCPPYYQSTPGKAFKECGSNGTWSVHSSLQIEHTDYSACFNIDKSRAILQATLVIDLAGHILSICSLFLAIIMIFSFRNLRKDFVTKESLCLHLNLFCAMIGLSISTSFFHQLIYFDAFKNISSPIFLKNPIWCRALHAAMIYFRSTSFMSMFSEGVYLYRKIQNMMMKGYLDPPRKYIIFTWTIPFLTTTTFVIAKIVGEQNLRCWIGNELGLYELIYMVPNLIFLLINMVLIVSIELNLCKQIHTYKHDRRAAILKHAMRATLFLVPVFGIQFIFIIYRPKDWPPYEAIGAIISSTQGLFVSILYFFTTKEVRQELSSIFCNCSILKNNNHYLCCSTIHHHEAVNNERSEGDTPMKKLPKKVEDNKYQKDNISPIDDMNCTEDTEL